MKPIALTISLLVFLFSVVIAQVDNDNARAIRGPPRRVAAPDKPINEDMNRKLPGDDDDDVRIYSQVFHRFFQVIKFSMHVLFSTG